MQPIPPSPPPPPLPPQPPAAAQGESNISFKQIVNSDDFNCPILHKVMRHAVQLPCGHNFEERAIKRWFETNKKRACAVCNADCPVTPTKNLFLQNTINEWKKFANIPDDEEVEEIPPPPVAAQRPLPLSRQQIQEKLNDISAIYKQGSDGKEVALGMLLSLQQDYPDVEAFTNAIQRLLNPPPRENAPNGPGAQPVMMQGMPLPGGAVPLHGPVVYAVMASQGGGMPAPAARPPAPPQYAQAPQQYAPPAPMAHPALPAPAARLPVSKQPQYAPAPLPMSSRFLPGQPVNMAPVAMAQVARAPMPPAPAVYKLPVAPPAMPYGWAPAPPPAAAAAPQPSQGQKRDREAFEAAAPSHDPGAANNAPAPVGQFQQMERAKQRAVDVTAQGRIQEVFYLARNGSLKSFNAALTEETVQAVDDKGNSLLHEVVLAEREVKFLSKLIEHGAAINKVNAAGNTALHLATEAKSLRLVKKLKALGADLTVRNKAGKTAQEMAKTRKMVAFFNQPEEKEASSSSVEEKKEEGETDPEG